MMNIESLVETDVEAVYAYTATEVVRNKLSEKPFFSIIDEDDQYLGIITSRDIFRQSYHLVVDCLKDKPKFYPDHALLDAISLMLRLQEEALPVFYHDDSFMGVVSKDKLVSFLLRYTVHLENQAVQGKNL
jgi:CBS domain-containing protein